VSITQEKIHRYKKIAEDCFSDESMAEIHPDDLYELCEIAGRNNDYADLKSKADGLAEALGGLLQEVDIAVRVTGCQTDEMAAYRRISRAALAEYEGES
jgi:hypothetical protein